jgi:hypothetical protein
MVNWILTNVIGLESEWFWAMASFLAIAISLGLIYRQISLQRQANLLHVLGEMDKRWNSKEMLKARRQACEYFLSNELKINSAQGDVLGFFEDIGVYLERKVFDTEAVWDKYSYYIDYYWAMYQSHIKEFRTETNDNTWYEKFQRLHEKIERFSQKKGVSVSQKSKEDIEKFIRGELPGIAEQTKH